SRDGRTIAAASGTWHLPGRGSVRVWDAAEGRLLQTLPGFDETGVRGLALDPSGQTLVIGDAAGEVRIWSVVEQRELNRRRYPHVAETIAFTLDGSRLFIGCHDGVRVLDSKTYGVLTLIPHTGSRFALSPTGTQLASCTENSIRVWNIEQPDRPRFVQ